MLPRPGAPCRFRDRSNLDGAVKQVSPAEPGLGAQRLGVLQQLITQVSSLEQSALVVQVVLAGGHGVVPNTQIPWPSVL